MTMQRGGSIPMNGEGLLRYRRALQAGLGPTAFGFQVSETAGHVLAYSRAEGMLYVLLKLEVKQRGSAQRFGFVSTALALTAHYGKLVVPCQNSLRAVFADGTPPDMVAAYRFAVEADAAPQTP